MEKISKQEVTTDIVLEIRKPRKDNLYPVKLRVTHKRKQKYYTLRFSLKNKRPEDLTVHEQYWARRIDKGISMTKAEFVRARNEKSHDPFKTMFVYLNELEAIARNIKNTLNPFTFESFEKKYIQQPGTDYDLIFGLKDYAKKLKLEERISSAELCEFTASSLEKFTGKSWLSFEDVSVSFLNDYEKWMIQKGKSVTTIGMYLRNVRTIYRKILRESDVDPATYPFGTGGYTIPSGKNIKKALTHKEVGLIANHFCPNGSNQQKCRDYWLFSYLCNGINIKDLAGLKYNNIDGDLITLIRTKTKREKRQSPRVITIVITKQIGRIIDRWGNKPAEPDQYIFPIINNEMTPDRRHKVILQTIGLINDHIDIIAKAVKISQKVTTYTARHSFATVLKRSGASIEFISESLGHSNTGTTENYLADFEIEEKRKWAEKAADF